MIDNKNFKITSNNDEDMTSLEKQLLQEEVLNLPIMKKDEVNFETLYIYDLTDKYEVRVIIRNTARIPIDFKEMVVGIIDENENILGTCKMDLSFIGLVEPMAAKVININIDKTLIGNFNIMGDYKLMVAPKATMKNSLKLSIASFTDNILEYEKVELEDYVKNMPSVMEGSADAKVYKILKEIDDVYAIIVLVNATEENIKADNLKIIVHNSLGFVAARVYLKETDIVNSRSISVMKVKIDKEDYLEKIYDVSGYYGSISN